MTGGAKKQKVCIGRTTTLHVLHPLVEEGGGGTRISSDRDDRRIFWGLKFSNSGFLGVEEFWQVLFWVA